MRPQETHAEIVLKCSKLFARILDIKETNYLDVKAVAKRKMKER